MGSQASGLNMLLEMRRMQLKLDSTGGGLSVAKKANGARLSHSLPVKTLHLPCRLRQDHTQAIGAC